MIKINWVVLIFQIKDHDLYPSLVKGLKYYQQGSSFRQNIAWIHHCQILTKVIFVYEHCSFCLVCKSQSSSIKCPKKLHSVLLVILLQFMTYHLVFTNSGVVPLNSNNSEFLNNFLTSDRGSVATNQWGAEFFGIRIGKPELAASFIVSMVLP